MSSLETNNNNNIVTGPTKYDGKQLRIKTGIRKIVDYRNSVAVHIQSRIFRRDHRDRKCLQPDPLFNALMLPPLEFLDKPVSSVCTRLVRTATNKSRSQVFRVRWAPDGKRLITGSNSGEFTLWDGKTFNFETIQMAHNSAVRDMEWSHNTLWMISGDKGGFVKYWQSNMNNVFMKQTHDEEIRGLSFSPTDAKFASCSDDKTIKRWDFETCQEECVFRGHGAEVRCIDWNPSLKIIASGSKDSNMPVKLWDAGSGKCLETIYANKHAVSSVKWGRDENLLLTASRESVLMLYDLRKRSAPLKTYKGHKKDITAIAWHPFHSDLFVSGGSDGSINYWLTRNEKPIAVIENAHESQVWSLDWHPMGHLLASGSNDTSTKFWARNRLGDSMRDRYNLNAFPAPEEHDDDQEGFVGAEKGKNDDHEGSDFLIPGIDLPPLKINTHITEPEAKTSKRKHEGGTDTERNCAKLPRLEKRL